MPAPLQDGLVDAFLANLDQLPADHNGPVGRIKSLTNAQTKHYTHASQFNPAKIEVEPRNGFTSLSQVVRDTEGADIGGATWGESSLLDTFDDQLLNIDDRKPRVYNGYDAWTEYSGDRILTNKLREDSLVGGYGVSTTPDQSILGHVQAICYTQHPTTDEWGVWFAVRELPGSNFGQERRAEPLPGPWIAPPRQIGTESTAAVATVLNDGTRFYVIWNSDDVAHNFTVTAFDVNGAELDSLTFPKLDTTREPGWWDVILNKAIDPDVGRTLLHAQPAGDTDDPTVDVHVNFTSIYWNGIGLATAASTDATIICNGWCNFLENDFATTDSFLVTTGPGENNQDTHGWRIRNLAQIDHWEIGAMAAKIDAITGWVPAGSAPDLYTVIGTLETASVVGPQYDPQQRRIFTGRTNHSASTTERVSASQALVSKTTKLGDDRFSATFYESGSGLGAGSTTITPDVTAGDYFTGTARQSIKAMVGGSFSGPNQTFVVPTASVAPFPINVTQNSGGPQPVASPDKVEYLLAPAGLPWLAEGTPCLKWTIAACVSGTNIFGGRLKLLGTGSPGVDFTWDIYGPGGSGVYYTTTVNTNGGSLAGLTAPVTLTTGTAECISLTQYSIPDFADKYDATTTDVLPAGTIVVSGNATGANNGTFTIQRAFAGDPALPYFERVPCIWVTTVGQSSSGTGYTAVVHPGSLNVWGFGNTDILFASPLIGSSLIVEDDAQFPENNSGAIGYEITDVNLDQLTTNAGDTGTTRSQSFVAPLPTFNIALDKIPFTFFIQALAAELAINAFRFRGAYLQVSSSNAQVAGLYKIIDYKATLDGTIYTERVTQADDIPAYDFRIDSADAFVILFPIATTQPFQPTYFLTPALGARATVGMFDRGNAYNNWRISGVNTLDGHLTHVDTVNGSLHFVAPTTQERVSTANPNQQIIQSSIVGVKAWTISSEYGTAVNDLIPGCQAVDFEGAAFPEDGFALAPEAPWLVAQATASGIIGLRTSGTYVYTIVIESQDAQGRRVSSPPSPPLVIGPLSGTNNQITIGGDLPLPWDTTAVSPADTYGITNRLPVVISIYRTSYINGLETVSQYKITSDLSPNALASISADNPSGFSFTNGQFTYIDANPDLVVQVNEQLYSNVALPRFGAPAFSDGELWNDRYWIIDSAGGVWFSTPVTEGARPSWFPGFRIAPPVGDRPVSIRGLQQFLIVTCEKSIFYLPATALPSVLLTEAGQIPIPSLIPLPFPNGCTGQAITTPAGVMYASTAQNIWNVTRSLTNDPVSLNAFELFQAMTDGGRKVAGIAIDRDQRMMVSTGENPVVYDLISGLWSEWILPDDVGQVCAYNGRFAARSGEFILLQGDFFLDHVDGNDTGVDWSVALAGLSFGSVRAFVRLRRLQVVGKYRAPHKMQVTFAYPDDFPNDPTVCPVLEPVGGVPYLIEAIPGHGRASQFDVTIAVTHDAGTGHGDSCSVELLACKIGIQPGQRQVTPGQRV